MLVVSATTDTYRENDKMNSMRTCFPFRLSAWCTIVIIWCALLALPATAKAAVADHPFLGVNAWSQLTQQQMQDLSHTNFNMYRLSANYGQIATAPETYNWQEEDDIMLRAAESHTKLLVVLNGTPAWSATTQQPKTNNDINAFADFAAKFAARYQQTSSFWQQHPTVEPNPPIAYEIWNEPNFPAFWDGPPSAQEYAHLFNKTASAIRTVNTDIPILLGGMAFSETTAISPIVFLRTLLQSHIQPFAGVSLHTYNDPQRSLQNIRAVRSVLEATPYQHAGLWITEIGYTDGPSPSSSSREQQARRTRQIVQLLLAEKQKLNIDGALWFAYQDVPDIGNVHDLRKIFTGLRTVTGETKPSWYTYQTLAAQQAATKKCLLHKQTTINVHFTGKQYQRIQTLTRAAIKAGMPSVLHLQHKQTMPVSRTSKKLSRNIYQYPAQNSKEATTEKPVQTGISPSLANKINNHQQQTLQTYCDGQPFRYVFHR